MRIYILAYDINVLGGSGISIKMLSNHLQKLKHEVLIDGDEMLLEKVIEFNPDIIIGQQWATESASKIAHVLNVPFVLYVHGPGQYEYWFEKEIPNGMRCDYVIFNTREQYNLSKKVLRDINSCIINPPIIKEKCVADYNTRDKITMIGTENLKGWGIFMEIARNNPSLDFLWVTDIDPKKVHNIPNNITVKAKVSDVREIYGQTKILLIPSFFESYCRVALEAFCNGIPVIAHDLVGIRDATSCMAVYVQENSCIGEWDLALITVMNHYDHYCNQAACGAVRKNTSDQVRSFVEDIEIMIK